MTNGSVNQATRTAGTLIAGCTRTTAVQVILLVVSTIGFALSAASSLLVSETAVDPAGVLSVHHYVGRVASVATYLIVALICRVRPIRPLPLAIVALLCGLASSLAWSLGESSVVSGSFVALLGESAGALSDASHALVTLMFLCFIAQFVPRASGVCIPLGIAGSHLVFLALGSIPPEALHDWKRFLLVLGFLLGLVCYVASGMLFKGGALKGAATAKKEQDASYSFRGLARELSLVLAGVVVFPFLFVLIAALSDSAGVNPGMFNLPVEIAAIIVLVALAVGLFVSRGSLGIEATFVVVMPFFATALVLIPLFWGNETFAFGIMIKCGFLLYNAMLWSLLARQVRGDYRRALLYFSVATGMMDLFALLGRAAGSFAFATGFANADAVANVSLAAIWLLAMGLLVFFLLFRRREREQLREAQDAGERAQLDAQNADRFMQKCDEFAVQTGLSEREQEVMAEFARGRSADYIAKELFISRETVKTHLKRVYAKADVHNRQELLDAIENGNKKE